MISDTTPLKLWLDDYRPMPEGYNYHAWTAKDAMARLREGNVIEISLDHDLADEQYPMGGESPIHYTDRASSFQEETGYTVAREMDHLIREKKIDFPIWNCHSANPVGRMNIEETLRRLERDLNTIREKRRIKRETTHQKQPNPSEP